MTSAPRSGTPVWLKVGEKAVLAAYGRRTGLEGVPTGQAGWWAVLPDDDDLDLGWLAEIHAPQGWRSAGTLFLMAAEANRPPPSFLLFRRLWCRLVGHRWRIRERPNTFDQAIRMVQFDCPRCRESYACAKADMVPAILALYEKET